MAGHMRGLARPFEYGVPAGMAGRLAVITVGGRRTWRDPPACGRSGCAFTAVGHEQDRRDAMAARRQGQPPASGKIHVQNFGNDQPGGLGADRFLDRPEGLHRLADLDVKRGQPLTPEGLQARF